MEQTRHFDELDVAKDTIQLTMVMADEITNNPVAPIFRMDYQSYGLVYKRPCLFTYLQCFWLLALQDEITF